MAKIKLTGPKEPIDAHIIIGGSKSISNRALLIRALSGTDFNIINLSESDDTSVLKDLLTHGKTEYDCGHAGTSFRFLAAYLAIQEGEQILTGSERMLERPISPLVDALNYIGADIEYVDKHGFPPLRIGRFTGQKNSDVSIQANISSQFVSALCLVAPYLPKGLNIKLKGELVSSSYLKMTLEMMNYFGVSSHFNESEIKIDAQIYKSKEYIVESDWSSVSYLYAITALSKKSQITAKYFFKDSLQGDSEISNMMKSFGVETLLDDGELVLKWTSDKAEYVNFNFISHPDLYQTMAVTAAGLNIPLKATGLQTLLIKETDRIAALQNELRKIEIELIEKTDGQGNKVYELTGISKVDLPEFEDYEDHRMIMSLACLATISPVILDNPNVVSKSYPNFWKDLETMGFVISSV